MKTVFLSLLIFTTYHLKR